MSTLTAFSEKERAYHQYQAMRLPISFHAPEPRSQERQGPDTGRLSW
ncbi:MAG: hypothetical protein AADX96_25655 [Thiocapsa sp. C3-sup]